MSGQRNRRGRLQSHWAAAWFAGNFALAAMAFGVPQFGGAVPAVAPRAEAAVPEPQEGLRSTSLRLMSQNQYINTIISIFGPDIALKIRFAPVKRVDGLLAVGAGSAILTSGALDPLESTGRSVAGQAVDEAHRRLLVPCQPASQQAADAPCARSFFARVAPLLYRRSLSTAELDRLAATAGGAIGPAGDFYSGLAYALSGILVSPEFLYIRETAEPDPGDVRVWRLDGFSKASRLSYLLWNSGPDTALLDAAARGDLHKPAGIKREVDRLIDSPRFKDGVREFFRDFLVLEGFDNLSKDPTIYPAFSLKAVQEARDQTLLTVVDHLVTQHGDYRDLFTTRRTMVSSELAVLYRLPVDTGALGWVTHEFAPGDPRAGLLSQIGFLAQYGHPGRSSPTRRGRAIREVLLCQTVPDPPPNVDFSNFENPKSGLRTARERLTAHQENPVCAGCHRITDPIGLSLENFDGAGQFRTTENSGVIDASGSLDGTTFRDAVGLGEAVSKNPALKSCVVNRLYAYSAGQAVTQEQEPLLARYEAVLDKRGYRFDDMLRLIILDKSFFAVKPMQVTSTALARIPSAGGSHADKN